MKIALWGYGKMGKAIDALIDPSQHEVILRIGRDEQQALSFETLQQADVVIEFTTPESAFENLRFCLEAGMPVVSGSTGWLDQMPAIQALCTKRGGAFFYAPNFSIGVNLFFAVNQFLGELMEPWSDYQVQLKEIHHTEKKDAPSGTAVWLAEALLKALDRKTNWVNQPSERPEDLVIRSLREPQVPGTHVVQYQSAIDTIEIKHTAHSREGFARGAILAAEWIQGKAGFFGMADLLRDKLRK